ncbi:hypothetical protein [Helicobacter pylori]|uniref:hypothetical protein n=1 Tax=Helicobacter pylori TaxID=210 RepID=UPI0013E2A87E|nr:hypothetical protein [Helicobacter pylori]
MGVSVMDRSFYSRIACVFSLSSLEFFLPRYFVSCFCSPFTFKRPLFKRLFGLKLR